MAGLTNRIVRGLVYGTGAQSFVDGAVTYNALYRLGNRPYALSKVYGAAGRTQFATIYHTAGSTKAVRIREVLVAIEASTAAATVVTELNGLTATTTPATGNPAITPFPLDTSDGGAEATCLALPTTAGSQASLVAQTSWNLGITAAAPTTNPPPPLNWVNLYASTIDEQKPLLMRAGVAEGYAVTFDCSAAATITGYALIAFTEE